MLSILIQLVWLLYGIALPVSAVLSIPHSIPIIVTGFALLVINTIIGVSIIKPKRNYWNILILSIIMTVLSLATIFGYLLDCTLSDNNLCKIFRIIVSLHVILYIGDILWCSYYLSYPKNKILIRSLQYP